MLKRLRELWGARARIRALEEWRDRLARECEERAKSEGALKRENKALEDDRDRVRENWTVAFDRAREFAAQADELQARNTGLKEALDEALKSIKRIEAERDGFRAKLAEALERVADLEDQVEDLEETADELRAELAAFEELLDEAARKETRNARCIAALAGNRDCLIITTN